MVKKKNCAVKNSDHLANFYLRIKVIHNPNPDFFLKPKKTNTYDKQKRKSNITRFFRLIYSSFRRKRNIAERIKEGAAAESAFIELLMLLTQKMKLMMFNKSYFTCYFGCRSRVLNPLSLIFYTGQQFRVACTFLT